jgi:adenylosuccinate lyase
MEGYMNESKGDKELLSGEELKELERKLQEKQAEEERQRQEAGEKVFKKLSEEEPPRSTDPEEFLGETQMVPRLKRRDILIDTLRKKLFGKKE